MTRSGLSATLFWQFKAFHIYRIYVTDLYAFVITNQQSASHSVIHITVVVFAVDWCTLARLSTIYLSSQSQQPATVSRFVGHLGMITHDKTWPVGTDEAGQWNWLVWWGLKQVLNGDDLVRALVLGILRLQCQSINQKRIRVTKVTNVTARPLVYYSANK